MAEKWTDPNDVQLRTACCCCHGGFLTKMPECLTQCRSVDQCFCCETSQLCRLVVPSTCCAGEGQCFCIDERCAFPCTDAIPCGCALCGLRCCGKDPEATGEGGDRAADLVLPTHCCCYMCSIYPKFPECCGVASKSLCLCCDSRCGCKTLSSCTVCKGWGNCCCCDSRHGCPCDDDSPFSCAICGANLAGKAPIQTELSTPVTQLMDRAVTADAENKL